MTESRGERLRTEEKLRRRPDFLRCYDQGDRLAGRMATLFVAPNDGPCARLGITATRKLGPAVLRSRMRRCCREIYRRWPRRHDLPRVDIVINLRHPAVRAEFGELRRGLERQLSRLLPGGAS